MSVQFGGIEVDERLLGMDANEQPTRMERLESAAQALAEMGATDLTGTRIPASVVEPRPEVPIYAVDFKKIKALESAQARLKAIKKEVMAEFEPLIEAAIKQAANQEGIDATLEEVSEQVDALRENALNFARFQWEKSVARGEEKKTFMAPGGGGKITLSQRVKYFVPDDHESKLAFLTNVKENYALLDAVKIDGSKLANFAKRGLAGVESKIDFSIRLTEDKE